MNDTIKIWDNPEFGTVRTVEIDGEPWLVGKDVAETLGYSNTRDALSRHVDEDDKNTVVNPDGNKGNPNMVVINESGLYALVFRSKLPWAKKFQHWVTSEVLPSIRKHGMYAIDDLINNPELGVRAFTALMGESFYGFDGRASENKSSRSKGGRKAGANNGAHTESYILRCRFDVR